MSDSGPAFCDLALPVPVDQPFTYHLPAPLRERARPGARVLAPFGSRKLTGVVLRRHETPPAGKARDIIRLLDDEPALTPELLKLGRWIAEYYSAPLGEVLKTMLPLGGTTRTGKLLSLTAAGREAARQLADEDDDDRIVQVLRALGKRPLSEAYLKRKIPGIVPVVRNLRRKGWVASDPVVKQSDPLRARSGTLMLTAGALDTALEKTTRGERWLIDYLQRDPGPHRVDALTEERKDVKRVAANLAKAGAVNLWRDFGTPAAKSATHSPTRVRVSLNDDQQTAFDAVCSSLHTGKYKTFLIHGVTGSGKTEVYLRAIEEALRLGKSALLMVPEIALTPAVAGQFFARFGDLVAILHSAFSGLERADQWKRLRQGQARVAVGTRSAVFAPLVDLGLVIVDEEHDNSYKQDETPRYHGRDVAVVRGQRSGATVILGSATPSLESRYNAERGKYDLLRMPERIERRPLPEVEIIDMRLEFVETKRQDLFSRALEEALRARLDAGEQVMMLLNRRGFSSFVVCRSCGERIECQNCSVTLTFHRREQKLSCHYCDYAEPVPKTCPKCGSEYIYFMGTGSEKVEDYLRERLPTARIARLDRDTVRGRDHYESVLGAFREGRYDILVGTQMIAKGHDIPNVTLVGVVTADVGLGMPDFRAAERTFQLLTQVAGRAGRGDLKGQVLLQTINPDHYAIRFAAAQDYDGFYKKELNFRRLLHYPPLAPMAVLVVRSKKLEEALALSGKLGRHLHETVPDGVRLLGPAAAPLVRLKTDYRYQFILKGSNRKVVAEVVARARRFAAEENWPATALVIDVDPTSVM